MRTARVSRLRLKRVQSGVNFFCGIKKLNNLGLLLYAFKLFAMFCLSKTDAHYFGVFSAFARFTRSAYVKSASHDSDFLSENPHWFYPSGILMRTARVSRLRLKRVQSGVNFFCGIKKLNNLGLLLYAFKLFAMFCLSKTDAHYFGVFSAFARFTRSAYVKSASHDSDFLSENGN